MLAKKRYLNVPDLFVRRKNIGFVEILLY